MEWIDSVLTDAALAAQPPAAEGGAVSGTATPSTQAPEDWTAEEKKEQEAVDATIEELLKDAQNPSEVLLAELRRFEVWKPSRWRRKLFGDPRWCRRGFGRDRGRRMPPK